MKNFSQRFQYKKIFLTFLSIVAFNQAVQAQQDTIGFNSAYDYSTKTLRAIGGSCPNWTIIAAADGSTVPRAARVNSGAAWSTLLTNTHWISSVSDDASLAAGIYSFEIKLPLDDAIVVNFSTTEICSGDTTLFYDSTHANGITRRGLEMDVLADNDATVYLNNLQLGATRTTYGFKNPPLHIVDVNQSDFINGVNKLRIDVHNEGGPMGLDVAGLVAFDTTVFALQRKWTFGDGSTSTDKNPKHKYAAPGNYAVKLVVRDSSGFADSITKIVRVKALPVANAGPDVSICKGDGVKIGPWAGSSGVTYLWSPSKGLNSTTIKNPVASPDSTTIYIVTVFDSGCSNRDTVVVTVKPLPSADAGNDVSLCPGDSAQLQATGGTSYLWIPSTGLNKNNIPNPKAGPSTTRKYIVYVTNADGCTSTDSVTVTVGGLLTADAGSDVTICPGDTTQLLAKGGTNYFWQPTTGLDNPNIRNPNASPSVTTTYTVTATSGACTGKDSVTITVLPAITYTVTPNPVNLGITNVDSTKHGTINFTNTTPMRVRVKSATFVGTTFTHNLLNAFPLSLAQNEQVAIEFTATPTDTGIFTGELCVEMDSACPAKVCIPVTIEGTSVCLKPEVAAEMKKHPGDDVVVPIIVTPTTNIASSKEIALTVQFDSAMLRNISDPTSSYGTPTVVSSMPGVLSFILKPTSNLSPTSAILAELHLQALLSPKTKSEIAVASSRFKLSLTEIITGGNCSEMFSIDSSCIMPGSLRSSSSATIEGIYPNPIESGAKISVYVHGAPDVRIDVYDVFGRSVEKVFEGILSEGLHEFKLSNERINGVYFCRMVLAGKISTRMFIVNK